MHMRATLPWQQNRHHCSPRPRSTDGSTQCPRQSTLSVTPCKSRDWARRGTTRCRLGDLFPEPLLSAYFAALGVLNPMDRKNVRLLAGCAPEDEMDREIGEKFDAIVRVAASARPAADG